MRVGEGQGLVVGGRTAIVDVVGVVVRVAMVRAMCEAAGSNDNDRSTAPLSSPSLSTILVGSNNDVPVYLLGTTCVRLCV